MEPNPYESSAAASGETPDTGSDECKDPRPAWLKLWLAFATAVFVFRISSGVAWILMSLFITPRLVGPFAYLHGWRETAIVVLAVCLCVVAERQQERFFAARSRPTNIIFAVVLTLLALNPLRIAIDPQLVPVSSNAAPQRAAALSVPNRLEVGLTAHDVVN